MKNPNKQNQTFPSLEAAKLAAPLGTHFVHRATVCDDSGTGGFVGCFMTDAEEAQFNREYAEAMERYGD
jgi:hypothetical protein